MNLSNVANNILDLIFIPKCAACGIAIDSSKKALCDKCAYIYNLESKQLCTIALCRTHIVNVRCITAVIFSKCYVLQDIKLKKIL